MFRDKYTNFSFNDLRSENFKVWITNKADLKCNMTPDFTDKFNTPTYGQIRYYEGTTVDKQDISFQCVAVGITANEWRAITNWLSPLTIGKLRFEWNPHYYYVVKLSKAISGEYWALNTIDPILGNLFNVTFSVSFTTVYDWAALSESMEDMVLRSLPEKYRVRSWDQIKEAEVGNLFQIDDEYYECIKEVKSASNEFNNEYWKKVGINYSIFNNSYLVPTVVPAHNYSNVQVDRQSSFTSRAINVITTFNQNFILQVRDILYQIIGRIEYNNKTNKLVYKHYGVPHVSSLNDIQWPIKNQMYYVGVYYYQCNAVNPPTYTRVNNYIADDWEESILYDIHAIKYDVPEKDDDPCVAGSWYYYNDNYYLCSENTQANQLLNKYTRKSSVAPTNISFNLYCINNETIVVETTNTVLQVSAGANVDVTESCWCQNVGSYDGYPVIYSSIPYALKDNNTTYCEYDYNGAQNITYYTVLNSQYHTLSSNGVPLDTLINGIGVPVYKNINNSYRLTIPSGRPQLLKTILYDYENIEKTISKETKIHSTVFEFLLNDRPVYDRYTNFVLTIIKKKGVSNIYDINNYGEKAYSVYFDDADYLTVVNPKISYLKEPGGWKMQVAVPQDTLLGSFIPTYQDLNQYFYVSICDAYAFGFKVDNQNVGNISVAMQARDVI